MTKAYAFISTNKIFSIGLTWNDLSKFYPPIRDDLFTKDKYYIKSKFKNDVFQYFLDYFLDRSEAPMVNSENIYDYYILCNEFHFELFSNLLSQSEFKNMFSISFLEQIISNDIKDKSIFEIFISQNLDHFLQNFTNEMYNISINSLCNIFFNEQRNLKDSDLAYQFIQSGSNNNQNLFILLGSLQISKLTPELQKESILQKDDHFGFNPEIDINIFENDNSTNGAQNQINQQQESIHSLCSSSLFSLNFMYPSFSLFFMIFFTSHFSRFEIRFHVVPFMSLMLYISKNSVINDVVTFSK